MTGEAHGILLEGIYGTIIVIECRLSNSLPAVVVVGLASKIVAEAKERLRGAFAASQLPFPRKRITINLAPADLPKGSSGLDLAMAVTILRASEQIPNDPESSASTTAFIGELGLDGSLRPVRGIIGLLLAGRAQGIQTFYIPAQNLAQAQLVPGVQLIAMRHLKDLYRDQNGLAVLPVIATGDGQQRQYSVTEPTDVAMVVGQPAAKRALQIAAAGGHNLLLTGPPGVGKTALARLLAALLPPLKLEEILEVTHLHSLRTQQYDQLVTQAPFRSPHHTVPLSALLGSGKPPKPGEISLSHRGVLLLDELPEFQPRLLEALRQPLEDRQIILPYTKDGRAYPAHCIVVATANPCRCGYYGSDKACKCQPYQVAQYQRRLSGPVLDRIDLFCNVTNVQSQLLTRPKANQLATEVAQLAKTVQQARHVQAARYTQVSKLNSDMTRDDLQQHARLTTTARTFLETATSQLQLSNRAYLRCMKVSRTIADLENATTITHNHVAEALRYRAVPLGDH